MISPQEQLSYSSIHISVNQCDLWHFLPHYLFIWVLVYQGALWLLIWPSSLKAANQQKVNANLCSLLTKLCCLIRLLDKTDLLTCCARPTPLDENQTPDPAALEHFTLVTGTCNRYQKLSSTHMPLCRCIGTSRNQIMPSSPMCVCFQPVADKFLPPPRGPHKERWIQQSFNRQFSINCTDTGQLHEHRSNEAYWGTSQSCQKHPFRTSPALEK